MHRTRRFRALFVATAAALAVSIPTQTLALHATGPTDPGALQPAGGAVSFSFGASVGQVAGSASELVFGYPLGGKTKISELTWEIQDVAVAGVQASAGFGGRFTVNAGLWSALNEGGGQMVDRDWLYTEESYLVLTPDADNWTHESRHPDTSVDEGTMIDVNLAVLALKTGPFSLRGIAGYKSDTWRWSSRGGTYIYSDESLRDTVGSFPSGQEVIAYEQRYSIPYLGFGADWSTPVFSVETHLLVSLAVSATDSDYHVLRDTLFEGEFSSGTYVGLGLNAAWAFAPRWSATLGLEYQSISEMTGDVTVEAPEGRELFEDGGGLAMDAAMVTLGVAYRF